MREYLGAVMAVVLTVGMAGCGEDAPAPAPQGKARQTHGAADDPSAIDCPPTGVLCTPECGPDGTLNGAPCRTGHFNSETCHCEAVCALTPGPAGCTPGETFDTSSCTCVPRTCGGLLGAPCPDGWSCQDDAGDGCDPDQGGADCPGHCVPATSCPSTGILCTPECGPDGRLNGAPCQAGQLDPATCTCQPPGLPCGDTPCGTGEYCCSSSCGICAPIGALCPQIVCGEDH
jgi:hypothetical protein